MRFVALDSESHLIKPGLLAPRMVCLSWAERVKTGVVRTGLLNRDDGLSLIGEWLRDDDVIIVGHNLPYDFGVVANTHPDLLPAIFAKYEKGLALDTMTRQQLIDVAEGQAKYFIDEETGEYLKSSYGLADLSYRLNKRYVKKGNDTWRLRYALLDDVPCHAWPEEARKYAIDDAEITLEVFEAQERIIAEAAWTEDDDGVHRVANSVEQHRSAWALHLMSAWGIRTDATAVRELKAALERDYAEFMAELRPSGLFNIELPRVMRRGPRKGTVIPEKVTKHMKTVYERVAGCFKARGEDVPTTESLRVATDRKTLLATGDKQLMQLAELSATAKLLQTYVPALERGTRWPICCRYNNIMETGRTSCSGPNLQNPPRKGGVRECFIPRPGCAFVFSDYDTLELRALAQACLDILGHSEMAEALRRGEDLHLSLAAEMMGISVAEAKTRFDAGDDEIKLYRQQAKPANFGYPGGMGAEGFKTYAEGYGIVLTDAQAKELRDTWFRKWPEMEDYFAYITRLTETTDQLTQLRSGRVRGGASFCAAANGFFQGLAADGAKEALWRVAKECYLDDPSFDGLGPTALYGCRPVLFLHDEIGIEVSLMNPLAASQAADRLSQVMIESMARWIPDVPISCKPVMVRRWFKGAEAVRVNGVLVPSRPVREGKKTMWVADAEERGIQAA